MRLAVAGAGYRSAAQAFVDGNQTAAAAAVRLTGALGETAGMAGDDATATDFAAAHVNSLGCEYLPSPQLGYRGWLEQIADRVRSAATAPGS